MGDQIGGQLKFWTVSLALDKMYQIGNKLSEMMIQILKSAYM